MRILKTLSLLCLCFLIASPTFAGCLQDGCVSPCTSLEQLYDTSFDGLCSSWHFNGTFSLVNIGSPENYVAQAQGTLGGAVYQNTPTIPSNSVSQTVTLYLSKDVNAYGSERLWVKIFRPSDNTVLESLGTIYPTSPDGRYDFRCANNYAGQSVQVKVMYVTGLSPGDTVFNVTYLGFFANLT